MSNHQSAKAWTLIGAVALALTVGVLSRRGAVAPPEDMRDAVASPATPPALLVGGRVVQPNAGVFASPAGRRAEAERALVSSRMMKVSRAAHARAAKLRREARDAAQSIAVSKRA